MHPEAVWSTGATAGGASASQPAGATGSMPLDGWGLLRTLEYAGVIAAGAAVLAFPGAWLLRSLVGLGRLGRWVLALSLIPMLMPTYLAYAGWGLLRGPGTWIGDWVARQDPEFAVWVGKAFAVWGMILWSYPAAMLSQVVLFRRVSQSALESLRLEAGGWRVWVSRARLLMPGIGASLLVVGLLMVGSAVPLHVAQVQTYALQLWKFLQVTPAPGEVFVRSWPLLSLSLAGGLAAAALAVRASVRIVIANDPAEAYFGSPAKWSWGGWILVWLLSVAAPGALFLYSVRQWRSIADFWRTTGGAMVESLSIAGAVGLAGSVLTCLLLFLFSRERTARWAWGVGLLTLAVLLAMALYPGVLVGSAYALVFPALPESLTWKLGSFGDFLANYRVALAHVGRWGALAGLAAFKIAMSEPPAQRDQRRLDERRPAVSFVRLLLVPNLGVVLGVGVAMACLSLHEIESSVMVQAPGDQPLAQMLLDALHFARDEYLSAAGFNLLCVGSLVAVAAGWLLGPLVEPAPRPVGPESSKRGRSEVE
ncbi:MAG TPA: hypothetical protein PL072_07495 [Phycisphaerales bacterium]|nr:hypothetical protein [Phycisphaerales bacterium]